MEERSAIWKGRTTDPALGAEYWYQAIQLISDDSQVKEGSIVLNGYNFDEGVRLNQGRVGSADGPDAIRKMLARCAVGRSKGTLMDIGNLGPFDTVEEAQQTLAQKTTSILHQGGLPIHLGGGHDMSFGTGLGLLKAFPEAKIGIINFDAHFDLRPSTHGFHSGTPFLQLSKVIEPFYYLVIGIQQAANTKSLFDTAEKLNVTYLKDEDIISENVENIRKEMAKFMEYLDVIHLSIDMDFFPAGYAPGVSALNPVGVEPKIFLKLLNEVVGSGKVKAVDIAEMNPFLDIGGQTAKLAARIIHEIVDGIFTK